MNWLCIIGVQCLGEVTLVGLQPVVTIILIGFSRFLYIDQSIVPRWSCSFLSLIVIIGERALSCMIR